MVGTIECHAIGLGFDAMASTKDFYALQPAVLSCLPQLSLISITVVIGNVNALKYPG